MNSIACESLSKSYYDGKLRVEVFKNINLNVATGEMVAIIGVSGAGKSTLLQLLGGLDVPTVGSVWVAGKNMSAMSEKAKGQLRNQYLGFIYQFHHLLPEFNALENVCMPLLIRGVAPKIAAAKATEMIARVGLSDRLDHRVGEMSGGERQRIAIARALVAEPHCVLADEPTGNLDQSTAEQIYELMLQLNKELGTSFVIVTHNEALARRMHRTLVLGGGSLSERK